MRPDSHHPREPAATETRVPADFYDELTAGLDQPPEPNANLTRAFSRARQVIRGSTVPSDPFPDKVRIEFELHGCDRYAAWKDVQSSLEAGWSAERAWCVYGDTVPQTWEWLCEHYGPAEQIIATAVVLTPEEPKPEPATPGERPLISPRALSWLIQHAMNSLAGGDDDDDKCCSNCCGPCAALQEMLDADTLDAAVGGGTDMPGYDWWTGTGVDRQWITDRMGRRHADRAGGQEVWCDQ